MPTRQYKQRWSTRVEPELRHIIKKLPPLHVQPWMLKLGFVQLANLYLNVAPVRLPKDVTMTRIPNVGILLEPITSAESSDESSKGVVIMWVHGGGRIMGHPKMDVSKLTSRLVQCTGLPVLSVDYRTAPQHVFPAALDDCVEAYEWLCQQESVNRIIVAGESAGAGLVAELCQRLYDESNEKEDSLPLPIAQVLCYPMLDDRTVLDQEKTQRKHLLWNNKGNRIGWEAYLGPDHSPGDEELPKYAAAARREDLSGLPSAWVLACSLDLFYDEDMEYAKRLQDAGVETEVMELEGGFHGILAWGTTEKPIVQIYDEMGSFIRRCAEACNE